MVEGSFPEYKLGVVACSLLPRRGYPEPVVEGEGLHILPGEAERRTGPGEVVLVVHPNQKLVKFWLDGISLLALHLSSDRLV